MFTTLVGKILTNHTPWYQHVILKLSSMLKIFVNPSFKLYLILNIGKWLCQIISAYCFKAVVLIVTKL